MKVNEILENRSIAQIKQPRTSVHNFGINDAWFRVKYLKNGKHILDPSYSGWREMLRRCYSTCYQRKQPTYIGCSVCKEWLLFSKFDEWFLEHYVEDYQLDKDILFPGNKIYSPETCIFVPQLINKFVLSSNNSRGNFPLGVTWCINSNKFQAQCRNPITLCNESLGYFKDPEEAHQAWLKRKLEHIETLKTQLDAIDLRLYEAVKAKILSLK